MITKLPRWVEAGAFVLALVAGCINAIGLLGFEHQAISHLSGTATLLGVSVIDLALARSLHLFAILVSFLLGAALSGFLLYGSTLKLGRHYDTLLFIESLLLFASIYLLTRNQLYGHYMASLACGLQNALATTYSSAIVRTTHVTGIFTDLGIMAGRWIRGEGLDTRKLILFLLIISGFVFGGALGALLFVRLHFYALAIPAGVCILLAFSYRIYNGKRKRTSARDQH